MAGSDDMAKCTRVGCINRSIGKGLCSQHTSKDKVEVYRPRLRPDYDYLYNTGWWRRVRKHLLSSTPLCARCSYYKQTTQAVDVDHIIMHRGDEQLFYDINSLQPLCRSCLLYTSPSPRDS